jgi:hypothetical protein
MPWCDITASADLAASAGTAIRLETTVGIARRWTSPAKERRVVIVRALQQYREDAGRNRSAGSLTFLPH